MLDILRHPPPEFTDAVRSHFARRRGAVLATTQVCACIVRECVRGCVSACVRACVGACVSRCVGACVSACVCACVRAHVCFAFARGRVTRTLSSSAYVGGTQSLGVPATALGPVLRVTP